MSRYYTRWWRRYTWDLKVKAIQKYGGRCILCGFSDYRALQFDHVAGGGSSGNKRGRGHTYQMYEAVLSGKIQGLQLLCANCHCIKTIENAENSREEFNDFLLKAMREVQNAIESQGQTPPTLGGSPTMAPGAGGGPIQ